MTSLMDPLRYLAAAAVLLTVAYALSCSSSESRKQGIVIADSDSYEASVFRQNCAICHGKEAYGRVVDGTLVPSLRFGDAAKKSEEEIYQQIAHGKLPMPSFSGQLTETEMRRMAKFIVRDLQGREPAAATGPDGPVEGASR